MVDTGVPSYVGVAGPVNGYVKRGYQRYYSSNTLLTPGDPNWRPPGTPPDIVPPPNVPPTPPDWPAVPPTLPPETCPPLASTWTSSDHVDVGDEIGYTPPVSDPNDDGIIFGHYSSSGLLLGFGWHGKGAHVTDANIQIHNLEIAQAIHDAVAQANQTQQLALPSIGGVATGTQTIPVTPFYDIQMAVQIALLQKTPEGMNLWFEMTLAPVTNGPFSNYYVVRSTPLQLPMTVDLSAPSA
jgi:hypothetical protein